MDHEILSFKDSHTWPWKHRSLLNRNLETFERVDSYNSSFSKLCYLVEWFARKTYKHRKVSLVKFSYIYVFIFKAALLQCGKEQEYTAALTAHYPLLLTFHLSSPSLWGVCWSQYFCWQMQEERLCKYLLIHTKRRVSVTSKIKSCPICRL